MTAPYHPSSQKFHDILVEMSHLHDRKQSDYGRKNDPFANVRGSEDFGIEPWVGAIVRANDKMRRLQKAAQGGTMANESVEDSLLDLAVYAIIGLVLYRERPTTEHLIEATVEAYSRQQQPRMTMQTREQAETCHECHRQYDFEYMREREETP